MQGRHPRPRIAPPTSSRRHPTGAITWIDGERALVARRTSGGVVTISTVPRGVAGEPGYLARVAHEIGEPDRVVIIGPESLRTQLEREYVAIYKRPDRLVDVEPEAPVSEADLVRRLDDLPG